MENKTGIIERSDLIKFLKITHKAKMCELLNRSGIRYVKDNEGYPALTWEALNMQLAGYTPHIQPAENDEGFNINAL